MAIGFIPFRAEHLERLSLQEAQESFGLCLGDPGYGPVLVQPRLAYSGVIDGRIVGCAGILPEWRTIDGGCAAVWALFGPIPRPAWVAVHRRAWRILDRAQRMGFKRLEAQVDADFMPGHRFVAALGFTREGGVAVGRSPRGVPVVRYERLTEDLWRQRRALREMGAAMRQDLREIAA